MREILFRGQLRRKGEKVNMAGEPLPSIWKKHIATAHYCPNCGTEMNRGDNHVGQST